jgi:L-lactate dehydrogenase complex protein LldG
VAGEGEAVTQSRGAILDAVRAGLRRSGGEATRLLETRSRLSAAARLTATPAEGDSRARFAQAVVRSLARLATAATESDAPALIADFLREAGEPAVLTMSPDHPILARIPWERAGLAARRVDAAAPASCVVNRAYAAIAETGAVALRDSASEPSSLAFLAETHVAVVGASDLLPDYEALWARLRRDGLPPTLHLICGPSRSADIEQTLLLGAHGPRRTLVLLVETL